MTLSDGFFRFFSPVSRNDRGSGWLCRHCWHPRDGHHTNGRCYTLKEIDARMAWVEWTGEWPGPDEGCVEGVLPRRRRRA